MEQRSAEVVRRWFGGHDSALHPEAVLNDHALGTVVSGSSEIAALMHEMYEVTYAPATADIKRLRTASDSATLEFTFSGAHGPTGSSRFSVDMCAIYGLADDCIVEIDLYYDRALLERN